MKFGLKRFFGNKLFALLYVLFGLILIGFKIKSLALPESFMKYSEWIFFFSGLLMIYAGFRFLFMRKK